MEESQPAPSRKRSVSKSRRPGMFDEDEDDHRAPTAADGSRPSFIEYLRKTPAEPLSTGVKAMLWAIGVLVGLLLLASLFKMAG
ncbi:hypothetical protein BH23PLA1_BH23PLA1_43670 [soil metagenome]